MRLLSSCSMSGENPIFLYQYQIIINCSIVRKIKLTIGPFLVETIYMNFYSIKHMYSTAQLNSIVHYNLAIRCQHILGFIQCSQYKQYILTIKNMLERTLFDRHVQNIKDKYQRICNHNTTSPPTPTEYQFITPARPIKHSQTPQQGPGESPSSKMQKLTRKFSSNRPDAREENKQERICLTARNPITKTKDIDDFVSQKQTILKRRVEENQRLLRKSKQLRSQESRKNSTQRETPTPQLQPQKTKREQNYASCLTERKTTLKNREPVQHSIKSQLVQANQKVRQLFAQKINKVIDESLKTKQLALFNEKKEGTKRTEKKESNLVSFTNLNAEPQGQDKKELKLASVFENTSKIQERIRALLSSH